MTTPSWKPIKDSIALAAMVVLTGFALWLVIEARRTGVYTGRGYPIRLAEDPERYWYYVNQMTFAVVFLGGFLALLVWVALLKRGEKGRILAYLEKRARERQPALEANTAQRLEP